MVALPPGSFLLGSPETEQGRNSDEGPQTKIELRGFAVSRLEITRGQYARFISETGHQGKGYRFVLGDTDHWQPDLDADWQNPGFPQEQDHPVVCVSWYDAKAYVAWLNTKVSGSPYRLLSESEWAYAAKAGTTTPYWWGEKEEDFCLYTNGGDAEARAIAPSWERSGTCSDGFAYTAPAGHYGEENAFGLLDMVGNVWEWTEDCYRGNLQDQPSNGTPFLEEACPKRVVRGGGWDYGPLYLRTSYRGAWNPEEGFANFGFRIARDL